MAECALERWGGDRFGSHSAGSHPKAKPHPGTLQLLRRLHYDVSKLRPKSWDEFDQPDSPRLDFVITLCDAARGEVCPVWAGHPLTAHWGTHDPAAATEENAELEFRRAYTEIENRVKIFTSLPIESLDRLALKTRLDAIGKTDLEPERR
jgi:protein-tyrosine-phosphatase